MDPQVAAGADQGKTFAAESDSPMAKALAPVVETVLALESIKKQASQPQEQRKENAMRIAIPTAEGRLCSHFGHCEQFAFIDVDEKTKAIVDRRMLTPPPHEPGVIPRWVAAQGATLVLAGGMGGRAQDLFAQRGIAVVTGAPCLPPEELVGQYCAGTLQTGANGCSH
jgi:predicted Fe-Mo cluster-binding NifX family protein